LQPIPYDKLGQMMQGLVPALLAREILVRLRFLGPGAMLGFLSLCVALAFSAFYEMIAWWVALIAGQGAEEFLGTQGDPWDTQSGMLMALLGAGDSVIGLARIQDRHIAALTDGGKRQADGTKAGTLRDFPACAMLVTNSDLQLEVVAVTVGRKTLAKRREIRGTQGTTEHAGAGAGLQQRIAEEIQ